MISPVRAGFDCTNFDFVLNRFCFLVWDSVTANQQTVGIDPNRCAGHEGAIIFSGNDLQVGSIVGQNGMNSIYLIRKGFSKNMKIKYIPIV